jgi:RNA polymerase sigma-70 factor (ECF subfamily)
MSGGGVDPLLLRLAVGDEEAFRMVYQRYADRLYRVALRILNRPEDAEDAVQQVFAGLVHTQATLTQVNDLGA